MTRILRPAADCPASDRAVPDFPTPERAALLAELRTAVAAAHHLDPTVLRVRAAAPVKVDTLFDLLGAEPVRTGAEALERIDALARELLARMRAADWSAAAAPGAVTSVLAASVPAAEAVLLRHARPLPGDTLPVAAGGR